mgnify:FL=1
MGVHSYSTIGEYYFQNLYDIRKYQESLGQRSFPVFRGHKLTRDDLIRRDIIQTLRSFFSLDLRSIENKYGIGFEEYFKAELVALDNYIKDGLVDVRDRAIVITEKGHQFANTVCYVFDNYKQTRPKF